MNNQINKIQTSILINQKEIILDDEILETISSDSARQRAIENSKGLLIQRLVYKSNGHKVVGFILEPRSITKPLATIIYCRSGISNVGVIKQKQLFLSMARFAQMGYVVLASQYSGSGGSGGKDELGGEEVDDILALKQIADAHPMIDSNKIGIYGESRGGLMVYRALAEVDWICAAISVAGVANLFRAEERRPKAKLIHTKIFGSGEEERRSRSAVYWPEKFVSDCPLLLMHGTNDKRVSYQDSVDLAAGLTQFDKPHELILFEEDDHAISKHKQDKREHIEEWFGRYLK